MKRITIVSVLALLTTLASTGCLGQSSTIEEETTESEQASRRSVYVSSDLEGNGIRRPNQTLELNLQPNGEDQGPHPEPWHEPAGPHPEPWKGGNPEPGGGGDNGGGGRAPDP